MKNLVSASAKVSLRNTTWVSEWMTQNYKLCLIFTYDLETDILFQTTDKVVIMTQEDTYSTMLLNLWSQFSVFKVKTEEKQINNICPSIAVFEMLVSPERDNSIPSFVQNFNRKLIIFSEWMNSVWQFFGEKWDQLNISCYELRYSKKLPDLLTQAAYKWTKTTLTASDIYYLRWNIKKLLLWIQIHVIFLETGNGNYKFNVFSGGRTKCFMVKYLNPIVYGYL